MIRRRPLRAIVAAAFLGGCAHTADFTAPADLCDVPRTYLDVEAHDDPERSLGETTFSQSLREAYMAPSPVRHAEEEPVSPSMLLLSGGSQNGAFGGGFVHRWAEERPGGLPRFKVVTGISTGAIYSTHAFLDRTDVIVRNERIFAEKEILRRYVGKGGMRSISGGITTVRKGAVGDLGPMRTRYLAELTDEVMRAVADEADAGRKLYVAAVDVDLAKAVIFDLTAYAQAYNRLPRGAEAALEHRRACYADVILASSSVPVAAPPTFIDNRMYIDGGARFGFITDEIGKTADELGQWLDRGGPRSTDEPWRPNLYLLVNGTLEVEARCGKLKARKEDDPCAPGTPKGSPEGQHEKWDLLGLIERSVGILINQVYRFSNERVWLAASDRGFVPHMQRILPDLNAAKRAIGFKGESGEKTCAEWAAVDDRVESPLEFHPRYMHCLVEYGFERARKSKWACFDPLPPGIPETAKKKAWDERCRNVPQTFTDDPRIRIPLAAKPAA